MLAIGELAILVTVIMGLLIYSLTSHRRESRLINDNSVLKKEIAATEEKHNNIFERNNKEKSEFTIIKSELEDIINKQQEQIAEQERKLTLFTKYTFDPRMSLFILDNKGYCSVCMFSKFKDVQIGVPGNQFKCPSCGVDYSRSPQMVVINDYFKPL